ncbi:predicted protein [Chaetoceros tenuissimus]|uniref:Uncharacterized protein n=1 Tax=Chaetoceros tenuissimus TaxID=426638 RepID=A0AAD3D2X9_9STRA|nr:predicted protein [Chaetoceros tenuissimus]
MADNAQLELPTEIITVGTLLKLWFGNADATSNIYGEHKTMWNDRSNSFPLDTSEFRKGSALYEAIKQYWNHPPSQYNVACFYGEVDDHGQPITFRHRCRIVDFIEGTRFVEAGYIVELVGEDVDPNPQKSYILKDDVDEALEEYYNRRRIEAEVAQIEEEDEDQRIEAAVAQVDEDNEDQRIEAAVAQIEEDDEDQAPPVMQEAGLVDNIDENQASPVIQEAAPSEVNGEEEEDTSGLDDNLEEDESPSKDRQLSKKGKEESSDLNEDHDLESRSEGASKDHLSAARIEDRNNSFEVSDEHEQDNEPEGAQPAEPDQDEFMDIFLEDINMERLTSPVNRLLGEVQIPSPYRNCEAEARTAVANNLVHLHHSPILTSIEQSPQNNAATTQNDDENTSNFDNTLFSGSTIQPPPRPSSAPPVLIHPRPSSEPSAIGTARPSIPTATSNHGRTIPTAAQNNNLLQQFSLSTAQQQLTINENLRRGDEEEHHPPVMHEAEVPPVQEQNNELGQAPVQERNHQEESAQDSDDESNGNMSYVAGRARFYSEDDSSIDNFVFESGWGSEYDGDEGPDPGVVEPHEAARFRRLEQEERERQQRLQEQRQQQQQQQNQRNQQN